MWEMKARRSSSGQRREAREHRDDALDAAEWVRTRLDLAVDPLQARVLRTTNKRGILNCSRQWGKSTITAAKAVHQAYHTAESLTVVVSPSGRQSGEFLRKATKFVRKLGIRPKGDGDNEISLELPNGSRIVGLPGTESTIRGFSAVSLLLVDEAARCSDDLYLAIRPMLAVSDGTLWLMSTPMGKRGFFYETWANGGPEWERFRAPATECARIRKAFLDEERAIMGERWFRQEYLCEFEDSLSGVFARELVEGAITDEIKPLTIG
jgi:Terminase large subunit, T4likevirus-type, N-terminal